MAARFLQDREFSEVFQAAVLNLIIATVILALLIKPIKKMMRGVK